MTTSRAALVLALTLSAVGCSSTQVTVVRMGGLYLSRGEDCSISFENLSFQEATARYENIGMISLTGTAEFDDEAKKEVEVEACKMGAQVLTLNAAVNVSGSGIIQFLALRKREETAK